MTGENHRYHVFSTMFDNIFLTHIYFRCNKAIVFPEMNIFEEPIRRINLKNVSFKSLEVDNQFKIFVRNLT